MGAKETRPEVLVYNAAYWRQTPLMEVAESELAADLALGVVSAHAAARAVYEGMKARGSGTLLFTGGGLALNPAYGVGVGALSAVKAALRHLAYALAEEVKPSGIRVGTVTIAGTVAPGTPFDPDRIAEAFWELHRDSTRPMETIFDGS